MSLELTIRGASKIPVTLTGGPVTHPTTGYRLWRGQFTADEPIVALAMVLSGNTLYWTRTSHRGTSSLETSILFAPHDEAGLNIRVGFSILDATAISNTCVGSLQDYPTPLLRSFSTGELVDVATISTNQTCTLKALFLLRRDVASVRNGVWHARASMIDGVLDPWRTILTYGRAGKIDCLDFRTH
jgi:hypothetical protein